MNFLELGENMNKGKSVATDSFVGPQEFMKWIEEMDETLLNAMIKKNWGTWSTTTGHPKHIAISFLIITN